MSGRRFFDMYSKFRGDWSEVCPGGLAAVLRSYPVRASGIGVSLAFTLKEVLAPATPIAACLDGERLQRLTYRR